MDQHIEPGTGSFFMADIRSKRPTRRRAVAVGEISVGAVVFPLIVERRLPKGDALAMAELAGLQGTKLASLLIPLCHPLAWLSRARAVQLGCCLVVALPGSPRAAAQGFDILAPVLAHALAMVAGKDHA